MNTFLRKSPISYIFTPFFVYETLFPNVYVFLLHSCRNAISLPLSTRRWGRQ